MADRHIDKIIHMIRISRNRKELENLLMDLLTPAEIQDISRRIQIMELLVKGETQRSIAKKLSVSISKVTRGAYVVHYGKGISEKLKRTKS